MNSEKWGIVCVGFILAAFIVGAVVLLGIAAEKDAKTTAEFKKKCGMLGGNVIEIYRSPDLCVSEDGRILIKEKRSWEASQ